MCCWPPVPVARPSKPYAGTSSRPPKPIPSERTSTMTLEALPQLQQQLNQALSAEIPPRLLRKPQKIAIDFHDRPYYVAGAGQMGTRSSQRWHHAFFPHRHGLLQFQAVCCAITTGHGLTRGCSVGERGAEGGERGQHIALRSPLSTLRTGRVSKSHCTRDGLKLHYVIHRGLRLSLAFVLPQDDTVTVLKAL